MVISEIKLFQIPSEQFGKEKAEEFIGALKGTIDQKFEDQRSTFLTKEDKIDILKTIYFTSLTQFLAIVGSVLLIVNYMLK